MATENFGFSRSSSFETIPLDDYLDDYYTQDLPGYDDNAPTSKIERIIKKFIAAESSLNKTPEEHGFSWIGIGISRIFTGLGEFVTGFFSTIGYGVYELCNEKPNTDTARKYSVKTGYLDDFDDPFPKTAEEADQFYLTKKSFSLLVHGVGSILRGVPEILFISSPCLNINELEEVQRTFQDPSYEWDNPYYYTSGSVE